MQQEIVSNKLNYVKKKGGDPKETQCIKQNYITNGNITLSFQKKFGPISDENMWELDTNYTYTDYTLGWRGGLGRSWLR